ncbi:MAG: hypothetical protein ACK4V6_11590 [Microthrixaceae bacterium]
MAGEQAERRQLAALAAERLTSTLDVVLGDRLVPEPGVKPDRYADGVVVNAFGLLERCGRRAANPADDFTETVATARRRVGLAALRRLGDDASPAVDAATAVDEVLSERTDLARNLAGWVEQLDRAARAAVAASSITWCTSVLRLVGLEGSIRWADPSSASHWDVPDRLVRVSASYDAVRGGVVTGERLLLVADGVGGPSDRLRAAYLALVRSLGTRHAPVRVTLAAPSRGTMERIDVDEALLTLAVDRVVEHVAVRADRAAAPLPGRWCAHCHLLELCEEGRDVVDAAAGPSR